MNYKKIIAVSAVAALLLTGCGTSDNAKSGSELLAAGKYSAAADAFSEELKSDSKNVKLYTGLADAYVGEGEYEAAIDSLTEGYEQTKSDKIVDKMVEITDELYKTAADKAEYQTVLYCCEAILECADKASAFEQKAMCYLHMDRVDKAIETVSEGTSKTGDKSIAENVSSYIYTLGSKAYTSGEKASAKTYFEKVLELDPENSDAASMIKAIGDAPVDKSESEKKDEPEKTEEKSEKVEAEEKNEAPAKTPEQPVVQEQQPAAQAPASTQQNNNAQTSVPQAPAPSAVKYTVQIGAYAEKENADNKVAKANAAGFSAIVSAYGGLYHVTVGSFSSEAEANALASKAQSAGFNVIVLTD